MSKPPLSPHLQIYKPQLTSFLSITHRGTGVFLSLGSILILFWLAAGALGEEPYRAIQDCINSVTGKVAMLAWTFAFFFHLMNGIRHLFWDIGLGFELVNAYRSGYTVLFGSIVLTAAVWAYAMLEWGTP